MMIFGEQIQRVSIGKAGSRYLENKIESLKGIDGHVFYGPYLEISPGSYSVRLVFDVVMQGNESLKDDEFAFEVVYGERYLSQYYLNDRDAKAGMVALRFHVPEHAHDDGKLEIRLFSNGKRHLRVESVDFRSLDYYTEGN